MKRYIECCVEVRCDYLFTTMGSAASTIQEIQEVEVAYSKKNYPPPSLPKFNFRDLYKNIPIHDERDIADEGFDWLALEMSLKAEESRHSDQNKNKINSSSRTTIQSGEKFKGKIQKDKSDNKKRANSKLNHKHNESSEQDDEISEHENNRTTMVYNSRRTVDQHATSAKITEMETFGSLYEYLRIPIKKEFYKDAFFIRALLVWLGNQAIEKGKYNHDSLDSPIGILEHINRGSLTYTKAFVLLTRAAGIPCVLIDGYVKAGLYEPGDNLDTTTADTWCGVFVDGSWQLLHPYWVIKGNYGKQERGLVLIDTHDIIAIAVPSYNSKGRQIRFNEEFFMPQPEEFLSKCWTQNQEWQLLSKQSKAIPSLGAFYDSAFITQTFFEFRLEFTHKLNSILHSVNGKVRVEIDAPSNMASRLSFHCVLIPKEITRSDDDNLTLDNTDYAKFVLSFRSNERIIFDLRLPFEGKYSVEISGGIEKLYMLCRFLIVCTNPMENCQPLPVDTGIVGWGPGPTAEKRGLILPSNPSGFLSILPTEDRVIPPSFAKPENITYISFQLGRKALQKYNYSVDLRAAFHLAATNSTIRSDMDKKERKDTETKVPSTHNGRNPRGTLILIIQQQTTTETKAATYLSRCVEGQVDHANRLLRVKVTVPREGEYALVIKTTEFVIKKDIKVIVKDSTKAVCYYLLSASMDWAKQYTPEKLARRDLHTAFSEGSVERLQAAITKCKSVKIPVLDNEIAAAELRIEYMKIRRDLQDCIKRRNGVIINDTLKRVIKYRYRSAFVDEIEQILLFKNELLNLKGYPRGIYSLKEANEEIIKIVHPLPEVHNTIKALLLMLGYYGNMDDWPTIQSTIKIVANTLHFTNILKQMRELEHPKFPWHLVKRRHIEKVEMLLHKYPYDAVFKANQAAALFYRWVERCISMVPRKRKIANNEQENVSADTSKQHEKQHRRKERTN